MENLYTKVLEISTLNQHTKDDIYSLVSIDVRKLPVLYRNETNVKIIQNKYTSKEYKSFVITGADENASHFEGLFGKCLLHESNIAKYINGGFEGVQNKTKDFFAVYCGYEGYNDFLSKNKQDVKNSEKLKKRSPKITFKVNQVGENNNSAAKVKAKNLYL